MYQAYTIHALKKEVEEKLPDDTIVIDSGLNWFIIGTEATWDQLREQLSPVLVGVCKSKDIKERLNAELAKAKE